MKVKKIYSKIFSIEKNQYIKIKRNQLLILDALLDDGGNKIYKGKNKKYFFSEHFGMLDINKNGLDKLIVSAKTERIDEDDGDIYFPGDVDDAFEYEFIFHTHPPTAGLTRVDDGILYEFPSIHDIYHFTDLYNKGKTQGSIVVAPEGLYIICTMDNKKVKYSKSEKNFNDMINQLLEIQDKAIKEYGVDINADMYYNKIIQNKKYIKMYNEMVNKFFSNKIKIKYIARKYDDKIKKWYLPSFYISLNIIEPLK
jgi:hypothetical protein